VLWWGGAQTFGEGARAPPDTPLATGLCSGNLKTTAKIVIIIINLFAKAGCQ